jgi:hypothetical protein
VRLGLERERDRESTGKITECIACSSDKDRFICRGLLTARYDSLTLGHRPNKDITGTSHFYWKQDYRGKINCLCLLMFLHLLQIA